MTYPLTDFDNLIVDFKLNGSLINDFFYSIIGIGCIEEFVKIIPLLVMMRFTNAVNEPYDYIKYASLSALGFAFVENLIYFHESNLHIIHGRALTAVVSHMFNSSIIAYGMILNKYKRHENPYLNFIFFFALAAIAHGFYDFWLINKSASALRILTVLFILSSMYMWNSFKNNALNHSNF
jgi:RsiW-degrading membrane proteinase PrsW (M82 family)